MTEARKVADAIDAAIDEINLRLPDGFKIDKADDTVLFGPDGVLDSIKLVNLIVTAEKKIRQHCSKSLVLVDERAMSQKSSPFRTVGALREYATMLLEEPSADG